MKQSKNKLYIIDIKFKDGATARFEYSDGDMAEHHYNQFSVQGVIVGRIISSIIRTIE